ncbi:hypothetical protein M408DRAFT_333165 [Serendipita vermifera MAFF 305830]|uniref:Uncharacterized protein n=1 Tax=Serendipita vermifera MAFF 305830 TaxID=933852 RepID=A0A0C3ARR1_SERVB|nr:hypothetical protein M408DRAFT_333165 [Serendipita vermifera MAFF 305830]
MPGNDNLRSIAQGPRPVPRHQSNTAYSHNHSSSRTSNSTTGSNDWATPVPNPRSSTTRSVNGPVAYSIHQRDTLNNQQMHANWNPAGNPNIARGQSPYYRVADVPTSPRTSHTSSVMVVTPTSPNLHSRESQAWTIASSPSLLPNGSNGTISSGRPSIEETFNAPTNGPERYEQRYMYIYNAVAGGVNVQFILTVEAAPLTPDESVLTLTCKSGGIERSLCGREYMRLNVDPQTLKFHIFIFPKPSLPADCLFCVRVWLEALDVQHRIFSDENLWVGREPPFASIQHVALTQQGAPTIPFPSTRSEVGVIRKAYKGFVGRAACDFIVILKNLSALDGVWGISVEYQAGGVSRLLFEQVKLRFHCRIEDVRFVIYTVPIDSSIPYSNHRVRVWVRGLDGVYQRLFKSDEFRIGSQLAFEPLIHGPGKVVFATRDASSPAVALHSSLLHTEPPKGAAGMIGDRGAASSSGHASGSTALERNAREEAEYEARRMGISVGIGSGTGSGSGQNLPFDELPSYASLGVRP